MVRRRVHQFLAITLIAFHAAVALCGPCLHELPGLGHDAAAGASAQQNPLKASHDSADSCPVCHFLVQGQLPFPALCEVHQQAVGEWLSHPHATIQPFLVRLETRQRAPPVI